MTAILAIAIALYLLLGVASAAAFWWLWVRAMGERDAPKVTAEWAPGARSALERRKVI